VEHLHSVCITYTYSHNLVTLFRPVAKHLCSLKLMLWVCMPCKAQLAKFCFD
jgi:hypothetical protein